MPTRAWISIMVAFVVGVLYGWLLHPLERLLRVFEDWLVYSC